MGFSQHLKEELEYKGMLVKELSRATGIPKHTLDKYLLTNGTMPSADKAVAIAHALGVTVEYLVTGRKTELAKTQEQPLSPETRSIAGYVEPLPKEKRKIIELAVTELVRLLRQPSSNEPATLTLLQKVFIRLFS